MRPDFGKNSVLLDIGHGPYDQPHDKRPPYDPGALSPTGWTEFQVNMITAIAAQERLQTFGHHAAFVPFGLGLVERGMMARDFDVFVSIHHNALNGRTQGTEVAVRTDRALDADDELAASIAKSVSGVLGTKNRGVLPLRLAVLSGARKTNVRAAVLTEGFFMDVPGINLVDWARREGVAIAASIHAFLSSKKLVS